MERILKRVNMVAQDILKTLLPGAPLSPKQIARKLDVAPQSVRNAVVHLNALSLIERIDYGEYTLTDLGREVLERLSQPSTVQTSRRETQ